MIGRSVLMRGRHRLGGCVFRIRDEALVETEWLEQSPDGVAADYVSAVATDAPITLIDDEYFHWMSRIAHPAFFV